LSKLKKCRAYSSAEEASNSAAENAQQQEKPFNNVISPQSDDKLSEGKKPETGAVEEKKSRPRRILLPETVLKRDFVPKEKSSKKEKDSVSITSSKKFKKEKMDEEKQVVSQQEIYKKLIDTHVQSSAEIGVTIPRNERGELLIEISDFNLLFENKAVTEWLFTFLINSYWKFLIK
jgi:hypothetical protein